MLKSNQENHGNYIPVIADTKDIKDLIYIIRGQQVMLDSDLARLYHVETKAFNQAVKEIILVDNYIDLNTLKILSKKNSGYM